MSLDKLTKNLSYFIGDDIGLIIGAGVAFILLVTFLIYRALSGRQAKKSARRAPPAILASDETAEKKEAQGLAAIMETLNQQDADDTAQDTVPLTLEEENDALNEAEGQAENIEDIPLSTDDAETSEQDEANPVDTDIEIPKLGATPAKKKKKGFFSFGRNNSEDEADEIATTDLSDVAHDENATDSDEEESVEESLEESLETNEEAANSDALSVQDIMDEIAADVTANLEQNQETPETVTPSAPSRIEKLQDIERQMKALRELHDAGLIATEIYLHKSRELARKIHG